MTKSKKVAKFVTLADSIKNLESDPRIQKAIADASFSLVNPLSNSSGLFTYTSSNTSVATIVGNIVTMVGLGSSIITALQVASGIYSSNSVNTTLTDGETNSLTSYNLGMLFI